VTRQRKAQAITVAVMTAAIVAIVAGRTGWRPATRPDPTAQDVIYGMLDAARAGDVRGYMDAYAGAMETSLRQAIAESTEAGFAKYLKETNAPIKGIAISEPETQAEGQVKARVEYVFQDRNEIQYMYLEKMGRTWKITKVDSAQRIKTVIPYGTPVN
jgi:hypothetical protein